MDFGTDLASKSPKIHPIHIYGQREKGIFYISALGINWLMRIIYPILQQINYMYILILRLYKVLKVFLTKVKENLSFIHHGLNIWGIHIFQDEKVYP